MSAIPATSFPVIGIAGDAESSGMTVPLAVQSIVQNQVDQVLKETRKRQLD